MNGKKYLEYLESTETKDKIFDSFKDEILELQLLNADKYFTPDVSK